MRHLLIVIAALGCGGTPGDDATLVATGAGSVEVDALEFGGTAVGEQRPLVLQVTNRGGVATGTIAVAIGGAHANEFVIDNAGTTCAGSVLEAAASCDVAIAFSPAATGERTAELSIASTPGGTVTIALAGHGFVPTLRFQPSSLSFGLMRVGLLDQQTIEIHNDGSEAVPLDSIEATGPFALGTSVCGATLEPGTSCDVVVIASPTALGLATGELTVTSLGEPASADLAVRGGRLVTVVRTGGGTGDVTSAPGGIDCGTASCSALFEGDVVLTAVPNATSAITSWSEAGCTGDTCTVPADLTAQIVTVDFAFTGSTESSLAITFAGNATGEVYVRYPNGANDVGATCFASCTVPLIAGQNVDVSTASPSRGGAVTGASCAGAKNCTFTAPLGVTAVTATFTKDASEQWTRLFTDPIIAVAHTADGHVHVANGTSLVELSSAGATLSTQAAVVGPRALATGGPTNKVYRVATGCNGTARCIAVAPDGTYVVAGVTKFDIDDAMLWQRPAPGAFGEGGVAIDAQGIVYATTLDEQSDESIAVIRFAPDGTPLGPFPEFGSIGSYHGGELAIDSDGRLVATSTGHSNVHFHRARLDGTPDYHRVFEADFPSYAESGLATSANGHHVWWYETNDAGLPVSSMQVRGFTNAGTEVYSFERPLYEVLLASGNDPLIGLTILDVSYSSGGQIVIVGRYTTFNGEIGFVQAHAP